MSLFHLACVCVCVCVCVSRSVVSDSVTPWTVAHHTPMVHVILQARILEWFAIPFSKGYSQPRDWPWVSCIASRFFTVWATRKHSSHTVPQVHPRCFIWQDFLLFSYISPLDLLRNSWHISLYKFKGIQHDSLIYTCWRCSVTSDSLWLHRL